MLWKVWLLVRSDLPRNQGTNEGTRSPIALFWTAKKLQLSKGTFKKSKISSHPMCHKTMYDYHVPQNRGKRRHWKLLSEGQYHVFPQIVCLVSIHIVAFIWLLNLKLWVILWSAHLLHRVFRLLLHIKRPHTILKSLNIYLTLWVILWSAHLLHRVHPKGVSVRSPQGDQGCLARIHSLPG